MTVARPPHRATKPRDPNAPAATRIGVQRLFAAETGNYFLLLGTTVFLVIFGLVMVLSSSSIESHLKFDSFYQEFSKQSLYAIIGVPLMLVVSRVPSTFWKRWAWAGLGVGMLLQILVFTPLGLEYGGNRNWLDFQVFTIQPSELLKIALIVWIATILVAKKNLLGDWRHIAIPIVPVAGLAILLVLLGQDLGTTIVILLTIFAILYHAGVKLRFLIVPGVIIAVGGVIFAFTGKSRSQRITGWLNGCAEDNYMRFCWQPMHGEWALASGGVFGAGLGNSKAKWSWLPEAQNDYIFAIIGEELGLIGAVVVLALFTVLAIAFTRIMRANPDPFARLVTGGVMTWIVGQALINIAVVLQLLPVLGVPLPLISAGGSALIATLVAIGIVLSFARNVPDPELRAVAPLTQAERARSAASNRERPLR